MPIRRTVLAFVATFLCSVAVFTLPRAVWSSVQGAVAPSRQNRTTDSLARATPPDNVPAIAAAGPSIQRTGRSLPARLSGLLGIAVILLIGVALSRNRTAISLRVVSWGVGLQAAFAIFVLRVPLGQALFRRLGEIVTRVLSFSYVGSEFVFGEVGKQHSSLGVILAFQLLPAIIFVSALFAVMYYLGVMQVVVQAFAVGMTKLMRTSGAESLNVAASIFMGQTEAPLTIRPYLPTMTRSELMTVMTAGMAHISGSIMAAYIAFGIDARYLLTAVIMTAPGTIMMAKILEPETEVPVTLGSARIEIPRTDVNVVDAAARGTSEGLQLMLNVIAMLVSFVALVALTNGILGFLHRHLPLVPESLQLVLGWIFRPIAWLMGVPWHDSGTVGSLLGTRMVLNEFIAYSQLGPLKGSLDPVSFTIASFALCGFANIGSVGIQIGGIGALVPERKHDLARLGFRAMIAGTLANFLSATLAGLLL